VRRGGGCGGFRRAGPPHAEPKKSKQREQRQPDARCGQQQAMNHKSISVLLLHGADFRLFADLRQ